jgi:hypothetical protein
MHFAKFMHYMPQIYPCMIQTLFPVLVGRPASLLQALEPSIHSRCLCVPRRLHGNLLHGSIVLHYHWQGLWSGRQSTALILSLERVLLCLTGSLDVINGEKFGLSSLSPSANITGRTIEDFFPPVPSREASFMVMISSTVGSLLMFGGAGYSKSVIGLILCRTRCELGTLLMVSNRTPPNNAPSTPNQCWPPPQSGAHRASRDQLQPSC